MSGICDKCGQPLPAQARRDPPLPPLDFPAIVTIHDLPDPSKAEIELGATRGNINGLPCTVRLLRVLDGDRP